MNNQSQIGGEHNTQIINNGVSYSDVKEIVYDISYHLFWSNFPKLKEEAIKEAENNIKIFLNEFENKLILDFSKIDVTSFSSPDVQYSINDSILAVARYGDKIDYNILIELLLEKILDNKNDLIAVTISEAIKTVTKITKPQINFLSLLFLGNNSLYETNDFNELNELYCDISNIFKESFFMSEPNLNYLKYTGVYSVERLLGQNYLNRVYETYKQVPNITIELQNENNITIFIQKFIDSNLYKYELTKIGELIAISNLKKYFEIEIKDWFTI